MRDTGDARSAPGRPPWTFQRVLRRVLDVAAAAIVLGLAAWVALFVAFAPELPDASRIWAMPDRGPGIAVVAWNGEAIGRRGGERGGPVAYDALPKSLVEAVIATEDRRFFSHIGIDPVGLGRAAWRNLVAGEVVEGGSTITQQLVKNLFLTPERTFSRKIQEMFLAIWLETRLAKEEILAIYLNRVYFGAGAYGIENAARLYFDRPAERLDLAQAAMLAGLLKAPSRLSPTNDYEAAEARAAVVLAGMVDAGFLEPAEAEKARTHPAPVTERRESGLAVHFIDWVLADLPVDIAAVDRDLVVVTTLDPSLQALALAAIGKRMPPATPDRPQPEAAVVVLGEDGAVRAMLGARDGRESRFNRATAAARQPGSAFKPFVYVAALEAGLAPDSLVEDAPLTVEGWSPRNYDGRFSGPVTLAEALAQSINSVAVRLQERVGRGRVIDAARRMGITSDLEQVPSLALGTEEVTPLELTAAYLPMANGGLRMKPYAITEVRTSDGRVLWRQAPSHGSRAISAETAAAMRVMLEGVVSHGTGRAARLAATAAAGKTGTTQNLRDGWFVGFAGGLVTGVWTGYDDNQSLDGGGGGLPARIWQALMEPAVAVQVPMAAAPPAVSGSPSPFDLFARIADLLGGRSDGGSQPAAPGQPGAEPAPARRGELEGVVDWLRRNADRAPQTPGRSRAGPPPEDHGR
jgi:penicillin-binding protein 1A